MESRRFGWRQYTSNHIISVIVLVLSAWWSVQVSKYVPEPYLDEVFHIPQAQAYCRGNFTQWDPKLTTPPGLYLVSLLRKAIVRSICTVSNLRWENSNHLFLLLVLATRCRGLIEIVSLKLHPTRSNRWIEPAFAYSAHTIHTGVNMALFPPLFFFSGLYYTDVLSTAMVLYAYFAYLERQENFTIFSLASLNVFVMGLLSLTMRQTNIFWTAVMFGGLDLVRSIKLIDSSSREKQSKKFDSSVENNLHDKQVSILQGNLHDVALGKAGILDPILFFASLVTATLFNLAAVLCRLWPYISLLGIFTVFVLWNGGVVLGDKSNHVATLHLPQMLYLWPYFTFFSIPLLYPFALDILYSVTRRSEPQRKPASNGNGVASQYNQILLGIDNPFHWVIGILSALAGSFLIIHYNTIIHPFTLADNRHYVFYVFRYTILKHPAVKYLLAPVYLVCAFLVIRCLAGFHAAPSLEASKRCQSGAKPQISQDETDKSRQVQYESGRAENEEYQLFRQAPARDGNDLSFALIWLLSTALSLITAPLVEPRYFIIPWVMWRLHVPAAPVSKADDSKKSDSSTWLDFLKYWAYEGHDCRLWLETLWFLAINFVTCYVFLFRGFEWPQEPGKNQRFMW